MGTSAKAGALGLIIVYGSRRQFEKMGDTQVPIIATPLFMLFTQKITKGDVSKNVEGSLVFGRIGFNVFFGERSALLKEPFDMSHRVVNHDGVLVLIIYCV